MADRPLHPIPGLQEAVDGLLGAAERASIESHLADCPVCRREFEALKRAKDARPPRAKPPSPPTRW